MKRQSTFSLIVLLMAFQVATAQLKKHSNDEGKRVSLPERWTKTLVGELFYDTEFVFVDQQTEDILIIESFPKYFLLPQKAFPDDKQALEQFMSSLSKVHATEVLLSEGESISSVKHHQQQGVQALSFYSSHEDSDRRNYSWLFNTESHTVFLKIVSKSPQMNHSTEDVMRMIRHLTIEEEVAEPSGQQKLLGTLGYDFYMYPEITETSTDGSGDLYKNANKVFTEDFVVSAYSVSSFCTGIKVPHSVLNSVILNNYGIDDLLFGGELMYNKQSLTITLSNYETSDDEAFHTISTIIERDQCQHVLLYIVEESEALLNNFEQFIQHFFTKSITYQQFVDQMPASLKDKYVATLSKIAGKLSRLKMHKKAGKLYAQAYEIKPSADHIAYLLDNFNDRQKYQKGLEFIDEIEPTFVSADITSWKAWFFAKLNKFEQSAKAFNDVFNEAYSSDEDFFKYIELLNTLKDYRTVSQLIEKYKAQVQNQKSLKKAIAQNLTQVDKPKARQYILSLLKDEQFVIDHQFTMLSYLGDLEAFDAIIEFCQQRIAKGFESAILLNYLGDAQSQLGDIESALASMTKAHEMAPENTVIGTYYRSLLRKNGKADLSSLPDYIEKVDVPTALKEKISSIVPSNHLDSYENLYTVIAYFHETKHKNRKTIYEKITINNDSGVANKKTLKIRFDDEYEKIYINELKVHDNQGNVIAKFDRSNAYISTDDDGYTADSDKLLNIPVPSLAPGVTIEYAITVESINKNTSQYFQQELFVTSGATQYKAIVLQGALDEIAMTASEQLNEHRVSENSVYWDMKNLPNYKKTPLLPDLDEVFPFVEFSSVKPGWQQVGNKYLTSIEEKIDSVIDNELLLALTDESSDQVGNAQSIVSFVQKNISYQAIEFGYRAQIPNPSKLTLNNRYGDCKDHSVLLHDMLNASNIEAKLALVNTESDISTALPTSDQFNHMIVYLPSINGGVFVDPTDKDSTLNLFSQPSSLQGYHTLVLDHDHSYLKQIPYTKAGQNNFDIERTIDKKGNLYLYHEKATITGVFASGLRNYLKGIEIDEIESRILAWLNSYYSDLVLVAFKHNNIYDNTQALVLDFTFQQQVDDATILLPVFIERYAMEFTKSPNRIWDFEYKNRFNVTSKTSILNTKALKFKRIKENVDSHLMSYKVFSDKKHISFEAEVYNNRLPASDYLQLTQQSKKSYKIMENALIDKN